MTDLDKRIEWLRARVPIEDVYLEHVRFIMQHYADEYHQNKLKNNEVLDIVSDSVCECCNENEAKLTVKLCHSCEEYKLNTNDC
jgi:hypothetical protein